MQKAVVAVMAVVIIGAGVLALTKDDKPADTSNTPASSNQNNGNNESQAEPEETEQAAGTITYTGSGFSPETLTVKSGDTVTVRNESSRTIEFESDPHPAHTSNTELNIDTIRPGESKTFTVNRTGTFGYHDHLDSSKTGTIIVQ